MDNANLQSVLPGLLAMPLARPVENALERALGIREIRRVYGQIAGNSIAERLLEFLEISYRVAPKDLEQVPRKGATAMVVNHPYGILEGAALAAILRRVRSDVKFLANGILTAIPEVREMVVAVDPMGRSANSGGIRRAVRHLESAGMLVIFPAGEVSHFQLRERCVTDPPWSESIARLIEMAARRASGFEVVPAHVDGANSAMFQMAGLLHPRLRTALLPRELLNKRGATVEIRIGSPIAASKLLAIPSNRERIEYLRWRTYLLAERNVYKPRTRLPLPGRRRGRVAEPVAEPVSSERIALEIERLDPDRLMGSSGELSVYLARAGEIPDALREIGRLREIAFRAAGEGTGQAADLDEFDGRYLHLFLWNETRREIAGAYRLAGTDAGHALYTATLFHYGADFLRRIAPALELGRSFVRLEYQRSFAPLLLLWKGIGGFLARNPRYRVLFGPVSISNRYGSVSRRLMVSFLKRHAFWRELAPLVRADNPPPDGRELAVERLDLDDLSDVVSDIEPEKAGVPVLLRQYLKLGGKLLGFHVDRNFSDSLDGLILVDLDKTPRKLLERYLGKQEAKEFTLWNTAGRL